MSSRELVSRIGIEGALVVLSPLPFLFLMLDVNAWQVASSSIALMACLGCALTLFRKPVLGKSLGMVAVAGCYASAWPYLVADPFVALSATILLISALFWLVEFRIRWHQERKRDHVSRCEQRARWGSLMVPVVTVVSLLTRNASAAFSPFVMAASLLVAFVLYLHWAVAEKSKKRVLLAATGLVLMAASCFVDGASNMSSLSLLLSLLLLLSFPRHKGFFEIKADRWEILMGYPIRVLVVTFLGLCLAGIFLLSLPASTHDGAVDLVDAAFTAVSAVCVTGLIVLDTPNDFTGFGQVCILLLIQLGGLGIMSITAVALHAMGQRLSLKQEQMLTSMTNTEHQDLFDSLKIILKFTFTAEAAGAVLLFFLFLSSGDSAGMAAWRGIFTAISAFCNAGFALQSDSLIAYQSDALILHIVAALIVVGGMAPAISLMVPKWISGKRIPTTARIVLVTTVVLLVSGTFLMMAFEWNGALSGLSVADKMHNAWFQSVTLRTAGFNSVEIAGILSPTVLVMVVLMFIGGSPGGTAGGVKTVSIAVLAMTFWANIKNEKEIIIRNRRIHPTMIYRAITVIIAGMMVWFLVVLMLQVTQQISARDLIFEATSALATVGVSIGATARLDEIGKIIIITAMFVGRLGPMALVMFLSKEQYVSVARCTVGKISLT